MTVNNLFQREQWFVIPVNPQPWTVPPFQPGMKNGHMYVSPGRDVKGEDFKQAVRDELNRQGAYMMKAPYEIEFWFDHKLDSSKSKAVDATNMQKLAEDALQGIVIDNDRNVVSIHSRNFPQDKDAAGMFLIRVVDNAPEPGIPQEIAMEFSRVRKEILEGKTKQIKQIRETNTWP